MLTSASTKLREKVLTVRVFGYQSYSQLDIDSFLNFVNMVKLEVRTLSLPVLIPDKERKLTEIFILALLCGEGLHKTSLKAFIKPFEASQRSMKMKI